MMVSQLTGECLVFGRWAMGMNRTKTSRKLRNYLVRHVAKKACKWVLFSYKIKIKSIKTYFKRKSIIKYKDSFL